MPHDTPLITTLVAGFVLAFILGAAAHRLRLPPLVGYLVAGVLVGPYTPGFVADQSLAPQLAEIGVILLMFGVGLHFSLRDLLNARGIAVPGAIVQIAVATLMGWALGMVMGWSHGGSLVFGLALSVASTVVLLKALQDRRLVETERGKIAVGWLIVEDLAMVLALVIIPAVASIANGDAGVHPQAAGSLKALLGIDLGIAGIIAITILKVVAFVALMLLVGRKAIPRLLHRIAQTGSRELFRLGVLAMALGVAFGAAQLFGVSLALGAFFAGMILAESELSQRAAQESLPLRDAFSVLFFVSVGMLFNPVIILREPLMMLGVLFVIVIGKSVAAFLIVRAFGKSNATALTISASLAQIGEFSFILAELGVALKLLPPDGRDLILAGAILSIILNPLVFYVCDRLRPLLEGRMLRPGSVAATQTMQAGDPAQPAPPGSSAPTGAEASKPLAYAVHGGDPSAMELLNGTAENPNPTALAGHAVLVGFGRVGAIVGSELQATGTPFLVIEESDTRVASTRAMRIEVIAGNAANPSVLKLANPGGAKSLIVAIPDAFEAGRIAANARKVNPNIRIIARAHSDAGVEHLIKHGADTAIMGEREIALAMIEWMQGKTAPGA